MVAELDAGSTCMHAPGCYMLAVGPNAYAGASLDPVKRTAQHALHLSRSGNKGFAKLLKHVNPKERAHVTRGCLLYGFNEIHPDKIQQLLGGTPLTVRLVSFLTHFAEQLMLQVLLHGGGGRWEDFTVPQSRPSFFNKTISGFAQGVHANASENGLMAKWTKFTTETPPTAILLSKFIADCAAEGVLIEAKIADEAIEISKATYIGREAGSQSAWQVVAREALKIFGRCNSFKHSQSGAKSYLKSKADPTQSTSELKSEGASKAVVPKGVGSQKCLGCGKPGSSWRTCPRNDKHKKGVKRHEDGGGIEGERNGAVQRKGNGKHLYAPYLAGQKAPPKPQAKKAVLDDDDFAVAVVPRAASSRPGRAAAAKTSQKAEAVFDEDEDNDSEYVESD